MSTEQVIMMESQNLNSVSFAENESMNDNVTNRSNGRRIGFLRRKIVVLQEELDALLALEPVKVSKTLKGRPKSVKKLSPQQEADDDLFANLVDEMWSETTPDVKKFKAPVDIEEELVVEEESEVSANEIVVSKVVAKKEKKHALTEEEKEAKKAALAEEKKLKKEADKAAKKALKKSEGAKKAAATRAANKLALKAAATANDSDNESIASETAPIVSEVVAPIVSEAPVSKESNVSSKVVASKEKNAPVVSEAKSKVSKAVAEVVVEVKPTKVTVSRITIGDIKYLKSNTNVLYNPDTREEVGMYDAETNSVKPLPDNEDDEMSEDEYESEEE
jgi:hypothetical protein